MYNTMRVSNCHNGLKLVAALMSFTVNDFEDLLKIIEAQPEWRSRLRRALFPEIDLPKALQALAKAQVETNVALKRLETTVERLAIGQDQSRRDLEELKYDFKILKTDVGILKGKAQEQTYHNKADAIFGRYLRNGRKAANQIADLLYDGLENRQISEAEMTQVLAADLLWVGEERRTKLPLLLVMEASWLAETNDVERAATHAAILRRIGINALAVVGGQEWTEGARTLASSENVITTTNGSIDAASWQAAWSNTQTDELD